MKQSLIFVFLSILTILSESDGFTHSSGVYFDKVRNSNVHSYMLVSPFSSSNFNLIPSKRIDSTRLIERSSHESDINNVAITEQKRRNIGLDKEFAAVALPAFVSLAADPLASIVDAMYVGRLGAVEQAAMGIAVSLQFSVAKLYNDPLLKTSTSLVAGKSGDDLEASVATAIATSLVIGTIQTLVFIFLGGSMLSVMGAGASSEMRKPALSYLRYRAMGVPAATVLLVTTSIFRGRGDTKTPLYCSALGNIVNIVLDPILIFGCGMGCSGAGAATAISQWVTAIPLIYLLNKAVPIKLFNRGKQFYKDAYEAYLKAGGLIMLRTVAKIAAYTCTSSAAARLGTIPMAAYSLTFNLGFATSQLCESVSIAAQALLAREFPYNTKTKRESVAHIIRRANLLGLLISSLLAITTIMNTDSVLNQLTKSPAVFEMSRSIMPIVLLTQLFKGLAYSTGGIILGGLDWYWSSLGMQISAVVCIALTCILPNTLWNIWVALCAFMATQ
eukprot:gene5340-7410_t